MKPGVLIYKCRLCGELDKSMHSPHVEQTFKEIQVTGHNQDKDTFVITDHRNHYCGIGRQGVADLIGYEEDKA